MTTLTDTQVITASGGLVELGYSQITSAVSVTGSDISVIGDLTVVCDGSPVAIEFYSPRLDLAGTTLGDGCEIYLWVDGVKTGRIAERYHPNAATGPYTTTYGVRRLTPSAGSHTFKITATRQGATSPSISAGAGTTTAQSPAFLRVSKIVQATQWPAVTTGTIICTSSTRPSAPFEGQEIYETDTKRSWTRVGTQWVPDDMVFTNEAARDAAITSPTEGMRAYLTASTVAAATGATYSTPPTGITTIYNGSVWVCVTPVTAKSDVAGTTTSTSYVTTLTGDAVAVSVTLVTGTTALVSMGCTHNQTSLAFNNLAVSVSGATTIAASDPTTSTTGINNANTTSMFRNFVLTGLTAGTNTFTHNYKVQGNTGTFGRRDLTVQGIA